MAQVRIDPIIEKAIYDFIVAVLTATFGADVVKVIWDKQISDSRQNQSPKRPDLPFVTLNISTLPFKEGDAEIKYKELDTFSFPMRKAFTLTANAYAGPNLGAAPNDDKGYYNIIEAIVHALQLESFQQILRKAGISIRGNATPIELSDLLESVFEFRVGVDIFLGYSKVVDDVTGQIDTVHTEGTIGTFNIEETIGEPLP
jgi:hypothetical protein